MATHFKLDTITRSLKVTLGALLFLIFSSCSNDDPGQRSLKLLNENWKLSKLGSSDRIKVDMPATVQNTLFKDGLINDPFSGNEEHNIKWIEKEDWEYRTWFKPTAEWFDLDEVELICNGLDTYATVFLNGDTVLKADNMFRTWSANIKPYLKSGRNDLRIIFNSPIEKGNIEKYKLEYRLPTTDISETNKVASFVRKAPFHFGWDWAPRIITTGVWKDIEIKGWNHFSVEDLGMEIKELNRSEAKVVAKFNLKAKVEGKAYLRVTCDEVEIENNFEGYLMKPGVNYKEIEISIKDPKLWWPNGEGDQDLYHFHFDFSTDPQQKNVTRRSVRTGLRRVKLIQQRDSIGTSFYFTINNRKVFGKGANYIPQDVFLERKTDEEYRKLLMDVHRSNMNMIRVWGGGVYERDIFYDLCDSLGIMVWQDFMFACAMYPGDEAFLENVRREVDEQSKRLSNHPSLVLWCGNNEIDVAWNNWGWQEEFGYSYAQASKIYRDYELIFKEMIPDIVDKNDGDVPYVHTSPISNWGTKTNFDHSSMHYWGVWHGEHAFEKVKDRVPRFMAEYGFQSFPNTDLLSEYIDPKNLDLNSDEMLNRQKSYKGTGLIEKHIKDYYKEPDSFEDFVYLSQLTQSKYMEMAINTHRLENKRCSGTLYWQLNDCWPGPSWSTMDHYGNWKAAQYMVKDRYQPVIVIPQIEGNKFKVYADPQLNQILESDLVVKCISFDGEVIYEQEFSKTLVPGRKNMIVELFTSSLIPAGMKNAAYLKITLKNKDNVFDEEIFFLTKEKFLRLQQPEFSYSIDPGDTTSVSISSNTLVKNVELKFKGVHGNFSDNFFDMEPNRRYELKFVPRKKGEKGTELLISNLNSLYQ